MLWCYFQYCNFTRKLFESMTDFFQFMLHTATFEHFVSIRAQGGLFVAVTPGPELTVKRRGEKVTET